MQHNVNDIIVNQFTRSLKALKNILKTAEAHATERKFDPNLFLDMRLAPDMFPLVRQVRFVSDTAKGAVSRLSGKTAPVFEDNEKTMEELINRVQRTIDYVAEFKKETFADYKTKKVSFPFYPGVHLTGEDYLVQHAIPNFYFHISTTYSLLRASGVKIGKQDYLGEQNWLKES
jgi:hypothetical protein